MVQPSSLKPGAQVSLITTLLVNNIHCPSCVTYATDVLRPIPGVIQTNISIVDQQVRVQHQGSTGTASIIAKELIDAAFEVHHVTTCDANGQKVNEFDAHPSHSSKHLTRAWPLLISKGQRKHIDNCNACRSDAQSKRKSTRTWSAVRRKRRIEDEEGRGEKTQTPSWSGESLQEKSPGGVAVDGELEEESESSHEYEATISIGGMTCASCSGSITKELESLDIVLSVNINLMANNGTVVFRGPKENINKIREAIEDVGYDAEVEEVKERLISATILTGPRVFTSKKFKAMLSIEGMTCGSCVGTITRGLEGLPFVSSVNIDLLGNSGSIEFEGREKADQILGKIEDMGYGAMINSVDSISKADTIAVRGSGTSERTVTLAVDGMYCEHCPAKILTALSTSLVANSITIRQEPSLKVPLLTITYTPSPASRLNVRHLISIVNSVHSAFSTRVYHSPSIEERSRKMQRQEQHRILLRLLFTFLVAIPTFVIGIVYMSLVPKNNQSRVWLEETVWSGSVSRTEWALFIMTTPVMFFGADVFHRRTYKEVKALWRLGSKTPILRRFYRFGSMNLLITAGTSVAYFSSIAVLALDATTQPADGAVSMERGSQTYFDSVTFLTFFILIGKFLEAYSKAKAGDAVAMLSKLRPEEAVLVDSMRRESVDSDSSQQKAITERVSVDVLEVGDIVIVPHGTSPPTDGIICQSGSFSFDESTLTGEAKPVKKASGDKVFAGSFNVSQPVKMTVTELGGTSLLDQIVGVVRDGQTKRAPVERVADMLTGYFVPVITLIAISTFVIWFALGQSGALPQDWLDVQQGGWAFWSLEFAIAVFVVACPCGIGLAAPTAMFVGGGLAAKHGILVQGGGEAFQEASQLEAIVFDKTGTLTEGRMAVTHYEILHQENENMHNLAIAFKLAREMEDSSTHPIANALAQFCAEKLAEMEDINISSSEIKEVPGQGMTGIFAIQERYMSSDGSSESRSLMYEAAIGNQRLMSTVRGADRDDDGSGFFLNQLLTKYQTLGHSIAILSIRRVPPPSESGTASPASSVPSIMEPGILFAISDPIRSTTNAVIRALQEDQGLEIHMCTGDNLTTARAIASQIGIPLTHVRAGVLPQDKAAYIRELQSSGGEEREGKRRRRQRIIAFIGDGTNDTPALAVADVSIALSSGSDVAVSSASFVLLNSDLETVLQLVSLAKRVFNRVKLNFAWAAVYNICLVPIAAGIVYPAGQWRLSPVWASAAMAASSVSVVLSSLALRLPEIRFSSSGRK